MPTFSTLTLQKASELIPDASAAWLKSNKLFYTGDHWQSSAGWSGPMPESGHPVYNDLVLEIERGFVSKNTVAEVVNRHMAGVVGREPTWAMTVRRALAEDEEATEQEKALIDEAEALLTEWWDDAGRGISWLSEISQGIHGILQDATATCLWARRGMLRLFVPAGQLVETGTGKVVPVADLQTSIKKIYLDHPEPSQAALALDRDTMRAGGIYLYEKDREKRAELTYLDEAGNTVIRAAGTNEAESPAFVLPLGGLLLMHEMERSRIVTDQVVQNQKALNLALTMLSRNVVMAGFLERTYLNAQLPGRMEDDPNRPGLERFVPERLHVGAGATNFISGVTTFNDAGNEVLATPSVVYRDPVPVTTFQQTKEVSYQNILEETQQLHAMISGDAAASGESRKQAMADFEQSLSDTKTQVENAIRWLLETVLAMAAVFAGQPGRYAALRASATCRVTLGPISADDQRVAAELVDKEIISRETARSRVGVDDTEAEATKIESEQKAMGQRTQQNLASAVLNAQRSLNGGAGSNGLETGTQDNQDDNAN